MKKQLHTRSTELIKEGVKELIVREGQAEIIREPLKVELSGTIKAPGDFFANRKEDLKENECHVVYSKTDGKIVLTTDEGNYYGSRVTGSLRKNPDLVAFGINSGKMWSIKDLMQKLKMSRAFFPDKDECLNIVTNLSKSKIKVDTILEQETSNSGSSKNNIEVSVKSEFNLFFGLELPVFVGFDKKKFKTEICLNVRDKAVEFWLESVELEEILQSEMESIMNAEIKKFGNVICIEQ
jgi:hypothetical protein